MGPNLAVIDLGSNNITGTIPSELGALSLKELYLDDLLLTGSIPTELENLQDSIENIDLSDLNVTGRVYFTCDIPSASISIDMDGDCNNFCGTDDEECNGADIGTATCADVGCNGLGNAPTCTETCRLDYTSCEGAPDQYKVQLLLTTDSKGEQITWQIRNSSDVVIFDHNNGYRDNFTVMEHRCVEDDTYELEIEDSGGDGLCGSTHDGSYILTVDDIEVSGINPCFGSSIIHPFGFGVTASPSESKMPSNTPTSIPTSEPTSIPTSEPTSIPTSEPSV